MHHSEETAHLPVVDLAPIKGGGSDEDWKKVSEELCNACRKTGFAYLINHGIPQSEIDGWFAVAKRFFDLPMGEKLAVVKPEGWETVHQGYIIPRVEQGSALTPLIYDKEQMGKYGKLGIEEREAYLYNSKKPQDHANLFPSKDALPGFEEQLDKMNASLQKVTNDVMRILATGIPNYPLDTLSEKHKGTNNFLRFAHCGFSCIFRLTPDFSVPWMDVESNKINWLAPHSDIGTFTLDITGKVAGLEVADVNDRLKFRPVQHIPGAIVFNVADHLERMTNDQFRSTIHRVTPVRRKQGSMTEERYSILYFVIADNEAILEPLPGTWSESNPNKYEPISAKEWFERKLGALMGRNKA